MFTLILAKRISSIAPVVLAAVMALGMVVSLATAS